MSGQTKQWLTTGQAAKLCSVTSDTVLKWIRRGRLSGIRTAGGHFRIARHDIEALMTPHVAVESSPHYGNSTAPLRCWEYLSGRGEIRKECEQCTVYQVRAARCFEMSELGEGVDLGHQLCRTSCRECTYFRRVMNLATEVLFITRDDDLVASLEKEPCAEVSIRIARSGYEAAASLQDFRPAFTIVDETPAAGGSAELVENLASDPRIPGMKVILAVARGQAERRRAEALHGCVVSIIEKPFALRHVGEIVARFPVESIGLLDEKAS